MNIIVCVKQVPDTAEVKMNPETNTIIRSGVPNIVNPDDKHAVEAALKLREAHGGKVTILTMGPPQAKDAIKECLAMGADEGILLSDMAFGGSDALATSFALASGIRKLGEFDLILCGKQAIDGDTAQVGPELAEHLGIPQITYACEIFAEGNTLTVKRELDDTYEIVEVQLPALVTAVKNLNEPRFPTVKGTMKANRTEIPTLTAADLGVPAEQLGLKGSPTQVRRVFAPPVNASGVMVSADTVKETAELLTSKLIDAKII
ncbi:MAG: electron transfer flavoprotein subunit beta/FixA family protein [Negativicutes bacterium]|nr:electron transfer flavoprotein subunit beta/FixA family protein [Negativicutes bacterium]